MNRRDLLVSFLALGGTVVSRLSHAQRAQRLPTIGFLSLRPTPTNEEWERLLFTVKLKESGWVEGKSIRILRAFAEGRQDRLRALAEDLAHASVDLIYGFGPDAAVHAARATRTIPIVFWGVAWPVEQGLVDSLARPARNVTGIAWNAGTEMYVKQLEFIRQFAPGIKRVASFVLPRTPLKVSGGYYEDVTRELEAAAKALRLELTFFTVVESRDFDTAFDGILKSQAQALLVPTAPITAVSRESIVAFCNANRLPGFFDWSGFVDVGGLFSYGPEFLDMTARAVSYVDRILRGARAADLPVEFPRKYELAVNMKVAKALGVKVPQSVLGAADRVIE